jgi:3-dehydroquinate dehydratase/shikimate dehydrogenase
MGEPGLVTRVCAARFGAPWAYAGALAGPGQVSVERMRREFRFGSIGADTTLYGLFGQPVSHSLSPAMHNAALAELGLDAVYLPLAGSDVDDCLRFAEGFSLAGASVTAPFKSALLGRLAARDAEADRAQAVNTIRPVPGGWAGTSTDAAGFLAGLGPVKAAGKRVAILGAGGAARAAAVALANQGAIVTMYGRELERIRASAGSVGAHAALRPVPPGSWDLLVNATPVGTYPDVGASAFPEGVYDGELVYDLVYNPERTALLREAEAKGCLAVGGLGMLIEQARLQVRWWHGRVPAAEKMRDAALWRLGAAS